MRLGQIACLSLALSLAPVPGHSAAQLSAAPQGDVGLAPFLKGYDFLTVPLAESLEAKTPHVKQEAGASPTWKQRWDEARRLAVAGNLPQAAKLYQELLQEKEIAEARWELVTILVALGRDQEAVGDIEALNEESPNRSEYLQCLGAVDLHLGRFRGAAEAFARLHELQQDNAHALAGRIYALMAAGDKKSALPSLEALWRLTPDDIDLRQALATLAYELQAYELAWPHLLGLSSGPRATPELLLMAARTSDMLQRPEQSLLYWQRYVKARPDDPEGQQRLADFFEQRGQLHKALPFLLAIHQHRPEDQLIQKKIGQGYVMGQDFAKALPFLERYAALRPDDKEVASLLIKTHESLGHTTETLRALERYFAIEPQPAAADLKRAARLYEERGAHDEAITAYRRLLTLHPGDPALLRSLANHAMAAGRQEEALPAWEELIRLTPDDDRLYRSMASILEQLGRQPELDETLATIHRLDPTDHEIGLQLVARYAAVRDLQQAEAVLSTMAQQAARLPAAFYYWRGIVRLQQQDYVAALADLEGFLLKEPGNETARRQAMVAAGRLGEVNRLHSLFPPLPANDQQLSAPVDDKAPSVDFLLAAAQAYADCRAENGARVLFQRVIDTATGDLTALLNQAFAGLAASYSREGRPNEAEEALRIGLASTQDRHFFLPLLFSLALDQGQTAEAQAWLAALRPLMAAEWPRRLSLMEASLLTAQDEMRQARRLLRTLADDLPTAQTTPSEAETRETIANRLGLAAQWLKAGMPALAAQQCDKVLAVDDANLHAKVILAKSHAPQAQTVGHIDLPALRPEQLMDLAALYQTYGLSEEMTGAAGQALALAPHSLKAGLLLAEGLAAQSDFAAAQAQLERVIADHPDELPLQVRLLTLQAMRGEMVSLEGFIDSPLAQSRPELILLKARLLWRLQRWDESLDIYRQFLTPRVAERLRQYAADCQTVLPKVAIERSVWEVLTRDPGPDPESLFSDQVMAPAQVLSSLDQGQSRFSLAAARLVATYRWQAQFAMELAPRQSVVRREYTIAQKQYEAYLTRYPAERPVLYDLAGMYSLLGSLSQEAAAYDQLSAAGLDFPELDEARALNLLKQRPRITMTYGYQSEAGRQGYVDMREDSLGLSYWKSLSTQHETEMTVKRISYHAGNWDDVIRTTRATASYSAALLSGLTVRGTGGLESRDRGDGQTFLVNTAVVGKIGDGLVGTMSFERDLVTDTTASLRRQLVRQDLLGGVALDPLPRLSVGGDYLLRDYSDNNWTTGYDLWAAYLIFAEPTYLRLKYSYDFKESREGASFAEGGEDGFAANDHPYWAPKNYWVNQVGLHFKHSLSENSLARGAPQYYTLEYAVGHDADGYALQTGKAGLYAEFSPQCLLEAVSELATSQAFRKQEYRLSLIYRW